MILHLCCMPVQHVNRPNLDFRGFSGTVSSGELNQGELFWFPDHLETAKVKQIFFGDKPVKKCSMGEAVTITLDKEIDISRGDLILMRAAILHLQRHISLMLFGLTTTNAIPIEISY